MGSSIEINLSQRDSLDKWLSGSPKYPEIVGIQALGAATSFLNLLREICQNGRPERLVVSNRRNHGIGQRYKLPSLL
jgi:hypothetical protein